MTTTTSPTARTTPPTPARTPRARRGWRFWLTAIAGALAVVVVLAYGLTAALRVPPPHDLVRLQTTAPSAQGTVFPTRPVVNTGPAVVLETDDDAGSALPATVPWKGEEIPVSDMLATTNSRAFLVLRDGQIVQEWYADDVDAATQLSSWSVGKSVVSLAVGQAIGRGELAESDRLVDVLPEFATGGEFDDVTIGDLLDMASGIDVSENYNPWWPVDGTARLLLSTDLPGYLMDHRELAFEPGSKAEYRSVDTQMLGLVVERVNGKPLAQVVSEDLWTPIGAESDAAWNLDRVDGTEKSFCCLNATGRDFAHLGQLVLDGGQAQGEQVVPAEWIERISTPSGLPMGEWGYSAQWWHPPVGAPGGAARGDVLALGVYGQYIWVDPGTGTVIVKLSDHGTEQDEVDTVEAMRAIADRLGASAG